MPAVRRRAARGGPLPGAAVPGGRRGVPLPVLRRSRRRVEGRRTARARADARQRSHREPGDVPEGVRRRRRGARGAADLDMSPLPSPRGAGANGGAPGTKRDRNGGSGGSGGSGSEEDANHPGGGESPERAPKKFRAAATALLRGRHRPARRARGPGPGPGPGAGGGGGAGAGAGAGRRRPSLWTRCVLPRRRRRRGIPTTPSPTPPPGPPAAGPRSTSPASRRRWTRPSRGSDDGGAGAAGRPLGWTMARSLLRALPTLAAASATATHATRAGGSVCGVRPSRRAGWARTPGWRRRRFARRCAR